MVNSRLGIMSMARALLVLALCLAAYTSARAQAPGIDPAAVETLKRMTEFTRQLKGFSVHTQNTLEDLLESGQRIDFDVAANVTVHRPDQLFAERAGELVDQAFYYDGETLTLYNPSEGKYATVPAPKTVEELLDFSREDLGLIIPASDLVYRNSFAIMIEDVNSAIVIGDAVINGVTCEHLAFRRPDVDFQIWVAKGEQPLPCKFVVTDTSTPEQVSTIAVMSDWDLAPKVDDATFTFRPPQGAKRVSIKELGEISAFGR